MDLTLSNFQQKYEIPKGEHEILAYWEKIHAFERSVSERPEGKRYVFYDGPPFATGLPHYGHLLASTIKDVVPRYFTMKGYRVDRVWGWDCHGVPIENMIEKELGLKGGKKGIEALGIDKFNAACRSAILRFDTEWEKVIRRIGRWVDFAHSYKTMDKTYMESVWWAFKTLSDKGLVYEGRRVILYCPRCATPLSNFEIAMDNSYKDVVDNSLYVKFKKTGSDHEYLVAWTTTPWTLIGNVALAVDLQATYVSVAVGDEILWMAKSRQPVIAPDGEIRSEVKGEALVGWEYEPLYTYMPIEGKRAYYVTDASFVSLEDGSGIVHTAAIFGEDDYRLAVEKDLPCVPTLDDQGKFLPFVTPLSGVFYKKAEDWVISDLTARSLVYRAEKITHSYPFCYRCETPLYFNAVPAWFIHVQTMKKDLVSQNEHINWYPEHLKYGRFGKGLETAPDWNVSRSRYWGTPMPVWQGEKDGKTVTRIIGSLEEMKQWAVDPKEVEALTDIHREYLDGIALWVDDEKTVAGKRIPEVFDCWVESGSMPYASIHYPFEHTDLFRSTHPAQFIAEYIAQTRAWFYTLHVMSVGLFGTHTFENAVTTGTILAEDGTKMSKSKKNYPDPSGLIEKYGADALRFYLMASVVMKGENLNFSEDGVKDVYQKVLSLFWNIMSFYKLYVSSPPPAVAPECTHILDRWLVGKTNRMISQVTRSMDQYDTVSSCRQISEYLSDFSTWYVRRSRDRIQTDAVTAATFGWAIRMTTLVLAPFTPFLAERIYQNFGDSRDSVHLAVWPTYDDGYVDDALEQEMNSARAIVEVGHAVRKNAGIKLRQPLASAVVKTPASISKDVSAVIAEELNILSVTFERADTVEVTFDTTLTETLMQMGAIRELVRTIQVLRKEKGCTIDEQVTVTLPSSWKSLSAEALAVASKETLATLVWGTELSISTTKENNPSTG